MAAKKPVKSFRLSEDVIAGISMLKVYYSKELKISMSEANVIERLVREKLHEIKGEERINNENE